MLAAFLLLVSLGQDSTPPLFMWGIEGMGDPKSQKLVTVTPTPFGFASGLDVKSVILDPLPTREDPKPQSVLPLKTEITPKRALRAWFTPPGRRFHLRVTLSDGSVHKVDIYRPTPGSEEAKPKIYSVPSLQLIAPRGRWTKIAHRIGITSQRRAALEAPGSGLLEPVSVKPLDASGFRERLSNGGGPKISPIDLLIFSGNGAL